MKYAPMGDPVELLIHGYKLTLRVADAAMVEAGIPVLSRQELLLLLEDLGE